MAIKISGSTIIDDSRVILNSDKIGIGITSPGRDLDILSNVALVSDFPSAGIGVSANTTLTSNTPKAFQIFNNSSTAQVAISYTGRIDANEYFGTFKGTIDSGVAVENANKLKVTTSSSNSEFTIPFVNSSATTGTYQDLFIDSDVATALRFNASTGHFQINGTGKDLLSIRTTANAQNRGIAFQNSGNAYTAIINAEDQGNDAVDLVFHVDDSNNADPDLVEERMRLTKEGNLGIGDATTNPTEKLHVHTSSGEAVIKVQGATDSKLRLTAVNGDSVIQFGDGASDEAGSFQYDHGTDDLIYNRDGEKLRITSDGKVGINSSLPSNTLVVQEPTDNNPSIQLFRPSTGGDIASINWRTSQGNQASINYRGGGGSEGLQFYTGGTASSNLNMIIDTSGNVGIGTDSPEAKLDVYANNASAGGIVQVTQDGTGDAAIDFQLKGTREYSLGIDNSDSDKFKLSGSAGLDSDTLLTITNDGLVGVNYSTPRGLVDIRSHGSSDPYIPLYVTAQAAETSGANSGLTTVMLESNLNKRPELRLNNTHNGNWHESPGNTQHWRILWTASNESSQTPEAVELKPYTTGSGGAFGQFRIRVTDTVNGLVDNIRLRHTYQQFYINGSKTLENTTTGLGITESLYHIGDTDTLIQFETNTINFDTAGSERLQINSTGNVLPGANGTQNLGSSSKRWNILYANDVDISGDISLSGDINADDLYVSGIATFANDIHVADAIVHLGDTDTQINFGTNEIKFDTAASERLRITSNGAIQLSGGANGHLQIDDNGEFEIFESDTSLSMNNSSKIAMDFASNVARLRSSTNGTATIRPLGFFMGAVEKVRITPDGDVGIGTTNPNALLGVNVGSSVTAFNIEGTEGQLFSVTNNLSSGSIFAVNDISGTPSINVDADGTISLAPFLSSDKIGIGTTNPTNKLDVIGDVFVSSKVGINSTSPREKLDVAAGRIILDEGYQLTWANGTTNRARIHGDSGSNFIIETGSSNAEALRAKSDGNVHIGGKLGIGVNAGSPSYQLQIHESVNTAYAANATIAQLAVGNVNSSSATNAAGIHLFTDGNGRGVVNLSALNNSTNASADFVIQTRHNSTLAERLRITSTGNVGINEASNINGRLHVQHDALAENILYATRYNDQTNDKPILAITEAQMTGMTASGLVIGNHNRGIHIGPVFDASATVQTGFKTGIRISYTGNVGINSSIPSEKLDVDGNIKASGSITASSFVGPITGSASQISVTNETTDTTCFPVFVKSAATTNQDPHTSTSFEYNSSSKILISQTFQASNGNSPNVASRDKYRLWNNSAYAIGFDNAMTFGGLNDYATTFQMNNSSGRGWVFLDDAHSDAQGAMSLTTNGKMALAHSLRLGYGESDTTTPGATYRLDVSGNAAINSTSNQALYLNNTNTNGQTSIAFQSAGSTKFIVGSNKDSDANPDFFIFDDTNDKHRFNIKSDGKVGIATDDPQQQLHVVTTSAAATPLLLERTHNDNVIAQFKNSTASMYAGLADDALGWGVGTNADLGSQTNNKFMVRRSTGFVGVNIINPLANLDVRGTALIADDIGSVQPSTFPAPDVQLMVYTSTTGQPITNTNCARLLIATDAKNTGAQGYNGALDFGNSDASAANNSSQFNYRVASIMSNAAGDTSATVADGDLQFWTKPASGSLTQRLRITSAGSVNIGGDYTQTSRQLKVTGDAEVTGTLYANINGAITPTGNVTITGDLQVNGNTTLGDATSDSLTINATPTIINDSGLFVRTASNAPTNGAQIRFTDQSSAGQIGHIRYKHPDGTVAPGSNDGFIIGGTETLTIVKVEGRVLVDEKVGIGTNTASDILHIHSSSPGIRLSDSGNVGDNNPNPSPYAFAYFDANAANAIIHADKGNDVADSRVAFAVDNDEKMRIESDGNVAIGHQNPSALLHVQNASVTDTKIIIESTGTNSYPAFRVKNDARSYDLGIDGANDDFRIHDVTENATRFRVAADGFIGIGEDNPTTGLSIKTLGDYSLNDGNTYYMPVGKWASVWNHGNDIVNGTDYWVGFVGGYTASTSSVNISLAPNRANVNNQQGMYIAGEATGTSTSDFSVGKIIGGSATGQGTSGNVRATKSELFRITSGGALQIGSSTLTGYNQFNGPGRLNIQNNSADGTVDFSQGIVFTDNVNNQGTWTHGAIVCTGSSGYRGNLVFGTDDDGTRNNSASNISERMRITSGGSVNIGGSYTQTTRKLKVTGDAEITGTLFATTFNGALSGTADEVKTVTRSTNANHYLTFVDSDNASATAESIYTHGRLKYNPSTHTLRARNFFADADGGTNTDSQQIVAGDGSGSMAMTINDGYGNCNLAFNHRNGVPDVTGSSGRIWTTVDSSTATMYFELADNSTANSAKALTDVLYLQTNRVTPYVNVIPNTDGTINLGANGTRWATTYTDALEVTNNANIGGNLTVSGTLTYDDVTNIDAVGIITARAGIDVTGGKVDIQTGLLDLSKVGGDNIIEMGKGQTGNHYAYIDMVGDATYTDYGLRLLRGNSGANAQSQITHRGTGDFLISAAEAASIKIKTSTGTSAKGLTIAGTGKVGVNNDSPQQALQVDGFIYLGPNDTNTIVHGGASVTYSADTDIYFVADANDTSGPAPSGEFIWGGGSNTNTNSNRDFTATEFGNSGKPRNQYMILDENSLRPAANNGLDLGTSSLKFQEIFATTITADNIAGTVSAAGLDTQVLFNDGGNVGADAGLTFNKTTDFLTVGGNLSVQGGTLFLDETSGAIQKIVSNSGDLDLYADASVRFFESDNDTLMFEFDVNTGNADARIILENDTDTYFNHPANNQLGFTVGATDTLRLQAGKIGINQSSPGATLDIGGNTDGNIQAIMTRGNDTNFQLQFRNETSSNNANTTAGIFGLFYNNTSIVGMEFRRGTSTGAGSLKITTGGSDRIIIDTAGNLLRGGNSQDIGTSSARWDHGYFNTIDATNLTGTVAAAGADTQVLFNDGGDVGADAGLTFNKTTDKLTVGGDVKLGGTLFFDETSGGVEKIDVDGGNLDLHADGLIRFFESDGDTLMFTFDVNTTNNDARLIMENDTDTYFNHPANNTLAFTTAGSERLRIDANGNIGLNVTPKTSGTLYTTVDHFLVIGDNDTGIAQDGDGQLEIWANDQEIINFNTTQITPTKKMIPSSNGTLDLGSTTSRWGTIYATTIDGTITGTVNSASSADQVKTQSRNTNATHYVTFVTDNNGSATSETVYTDAGITYNPSTNILNLGSRAVAGNGSGSVAMTINDGYGNANIAFNHESGTPDVDGSSGRIECGVDGTTAEMMFELWDNVTAGTATGGASTNVKLRLTSSTVQVYEDLMPNSDSSRDIGSNTVRFANGYFDNVYATNINGGTGVLDLSVVYTGRSSPCTIPITVTGTSSKQINIPESSNAFGAKYVQTTEPTGNTICTGDIWYDTTAASGSGGIELTDSVEATYRNITFADDSNATDIKVNDNGRLQVRPSDGNLRVAGDIIAFYSSDARLKKNISPIKNALKKVTSISGNTFEWNEKSRNEGEDTGVIAQEVEALELPGLTTTRQDGTKAVKYEKLVPLLIEAIKELKSEINEMKANASVS